MGTETFYSDLSTINSFLDATNPQNFVSVPTDWLIIITDIVASTFAIESGHYKEVNLLGACSISAVLNVADKLEIAYAFGGDGASILIPPCLLENAKPALRAVQILSRTQFNMELRVGIVPMSVVIEAGYDVKVAKFEVSENYNQGVFTGGGLNYATGLTKAPGTAKLYQLQETGTIQADFTGLECRWQDIPSRHGETVSLLVLAMAHNDVENHAIYRDVIEQIYQVYGNEQDFHPVAIDSLTLSLQSRRLLPETKIRCYFGSRLNQWLYLSQIQLENLLGLFLMHFRIKTNEVNWGHYKQIVTAASDYKKFDDMLRMIIAGSVSQREQLTQYLEARYKEGKLVFGLHVSDRALMTCLVFERSGRQVHFIDGADGGYAMAAKPLKEKMKRKADNWKTYTKLLEKRQRIRAGKQESEPL